MTIPTTISTCATGTEQGKHVLRIVGYSKRRVRGERTHSLSGVFSVGGHEWIVLFFPDSNNGPGCVSAGLVLREKGSHKARASYQLSLVDQSTGLSFSVHKEPWRTFGPDDKSKVSLHAKKRSVFEAPRFLHDDCLIIECVVTVIKEAGAPTTKSVPKIEVPPSNIGEQFGKLLEEKEGVDVTFQVGGEAFTAHKIVLATRSPVFKAELYGSLSNAGAESITIEDLQADVFRALLYFIYTDSLPAMDDLEEDDGNEMIKHLLVAADRYDIERLKLMCQSILCENLHVQTVATTLALADRHHCELLKDACFEFITCSNVMDAVAKTQGYKNLKRTCPSVVIEAFEKTSMIRRA